MVTDKVLFYSRLPRSSKKKKSTFVNKHITKHISRQGGYYFTLLTQTQFVPVFVSDSRVKLSADFFFFPFFLKYTIILFAYY